MPNVKRTRTVRTKRKSGSTPYRSKKARANAKPAKKVAAKRKRKPSTVTRAKRAKKGSLALKRVVQSNSRAIKSIKDSTWGKYQTTNSVISGASNSTGWNGSAITVGSLRPVFLHLNNLHSDPLKGAPHFYRRKTLDYTLPADAFGNPHVVPLDDSGIANEFESLGQLKSQGVVQKTVYHQTAGTLGQPMKTPYPNGDKIKMHSVDLTFEITGFCSNTTVNFMVVEEKKGAVPFDPWQAKTSFASQKARHLPYLLPAFNSVDDRMSPIQIDKRFNILQRKTVYINNKNTSLGSTDPTQPTSTNSSLIKEVTGERHLGSGTGGTVVDGMPNQLSTTKNVQYVNMKYAPHVGLYPLKRAIGEAEGAGESMGIRPNPYEVRSLGNMAWDNFSPSTNKFLIITTDHAWVPPRAQLTTTTNVNGVSVPDESDAQYATYLDLLYHSQPLIRCLRKCTWQDKHVPSSPMGISITGEPMSDGRRLEVSNKTEWEANFTRKGLLEGYMSANPGHAYNHDYPTQQDATPVGLWFHEHKQLEDYFQRYPYPDAENMIEDPTV